MHSPKLPEFSSFEVSRPDLLSVSGSSSLSKTAALIEESAIAFDLSTPRHIAFVDTKLADVDSLIAGIEGAQVVLIDAGKNGIAQITSALSKYNNLESVQIFSHGSEGQLQLGDALLSAATVERYGESLRQWSSALSAEADVMIYGCNLAAGESGLSLIDRLGELTGADVAASDDVTGVEGDWQLEVSRGTIESEVVLGVSAQRTYAANLALLSNGSFERGLNNWKLFNGEVATTTDAVDGSLAVEIAGDSRGVKQTVVAQSGQLYKLMGSGKANSPGASAGLTFYDGNFSRLASKNQKVSQGGWETFSVAREAPEGTRYVQAWGYKSSSAGSFFLDGLTLTVDDSEPVAPPPPSGSDELLLNAGFESGLAGWRGRNGSEQIATSGALSGSQALKLTSAGSGTRQILEIEGGATYKLSGYGTNSSSSYAGFGVTFYDASNQKIADSTVGKRIRSGRWSRYEGEAIAPDNAKTVRFWTYKSRDNGTALFDQLSLTAVDTTPPNPNPSDPGRIGLDDSTLSVNEDAGSVTVTINRTGDSQGAATVDYRTVAGSATAGLDYQAVTGRLTFADGQTQRSVEVPILDDNNPEEQESFGFAIDNVTGSAVLGAPRTAQIAIADNDGFTYRGNQYVLTSSAKTWQQAQAEAESLGGNLVTINTAQEENWLKQTFSETQGFWIGLSDAETEGSFEWASGESVAYTNWAPNEPNDGGFGQDYVWMNYSGSRQWDDNGGTATFFGIVEIGDYNGPVNGQGDGLKGEYYNNIDFTDLVETRIDRTVDFNWGFGSPSSAIESDTFSVRWSGKVEPRYSETYTFTTKTDDGVRLWVNNQLIIDKYRKQSVSEHTGTIDLVAGQQYDIRLEYFEETGAALSQLSWSSESQPLEIVPKSQLYADPIDDRSLKSENILDGLRFPTSVDWLTDGSERMLVAEQGGVVKLYENGALRRQPFIDISDQVNGVRDRGLLDIAVHPDFDNNPYVYLLFTYDPPEVFENTGEAGPDGTNNRAGRLIRVTADASNNYRTAVADSEVVLLGKNSTWDNFNGFTNSTFDFDELPAGILPDGSNLRDFLAADSESHTIGSVEFGPDGALYVSNGDGTSYNRVDPRTTRVLDVDNLSGKVLRINPINGRGLADNPFFNGDADANRSKVYQLGLRNPFRMTVDPENGNVYVGDVGWTSWEEINAGGPGANFGWPFYEGRSGTNARTGGYKDLPEATAFYNNNDATPALFALSHSATGINAIVMGDIYRGEAFPERYHGDLFFGDLGQGIIRNVSFDSVGGVSSVETFTTVEPYVVQTMQGPDDQLYYVNQLQGTVKRWVFE